MHTLTTPTLRLAKGLCVSNSNLNVGPGRLDPLGLGVLELQRRLLNGVVSNLRGLVNAQARTAEQINLETKKIPGLCKAN